jgi:hypothetical protein
MMDVLRAYFDLAKWIAAVVGVGFILSAVLYVIAMVLGVFL